MPTTPVAGHGSDRLAILRALRDRPAETIDQTTSARDLRPLARRLSDTLREIADLEAEQAAATPADESPLAKILRGRREAGKAVASPRASNRAVVDRGSAA